ncbi:hypothetical protein BC938DRAFT_471088 [Jimgerdemannia flammicorona]|uniref:Uncharacterized protein n=1 Tax=Jimgerdemannia flammicorona TaxID=994334 RepID=A0A433R020_9FUNG|nr:hypothetical protein BC938DRAFT_471088 [Jimgerdemannia flammicorona]
MSLNTRKLVAIQTLADAWKLRVAALLTFSKVAFQGVSRKSALTETASRNFAALHAEVAASQAVVDKVMKRPLPSVFVADNVVPLNLRKILNSGLDVIATGPDRDYLPGTGDKVQALIHPSLFPYIEGVSTVLDPSILPRLSNDPLRRIFED